jgi:FAD/FMN-containing dehydrogenase
MSTYDPARRKALGLMAAGAGAWLTETALAHAAPAVPTVTATALEALRNSISGRVIESGEPLFDTARSAIVWNQQVARLRRPDAIVQVASVQDVVTAVTFARANRLKVTTRSGGHHYHGAALRDGGLLLDLSRLNALSIDGTNQRASVQPAVKGGQFMAQLVPHALAFPVGHCSDVGLGGYILNGGLGLNGAEWGPACMNVTGIEVVTAQGEVIHADERQHADLFWAARGAGHGFFGVVTRFDVRLHPLPAGIHVYAATFSLSDAPVIARWLTGALHNLHATVEVDCVLGPLDANGRPVIALLATAMAAAPAVASERLAPLRTWPTTCKPIGPVLDQPSTMGGVFELQDAGFPNGKRMMGDVLWSDTPPDVLVAALERFVASAPPAPSAIFIVCMGERGSGFRMPVASQAALSHSAKNYLGAFGFWDDPAADANGKAWVREVMQAARPFGAGSYIGEADVTARPEAAQECFAPEAWARLAELRRRYDPEGVFYSYLAG